MTASGFFHAIVLIIEVLGVIAVCAGIVIAAVLALRTLRREGGAAAFETLRRALGGSILLGLEIFVAADIIRTIYTPTLQETLILALIVVIRTVLSMSIQIEINGVVPWWRALLTGGAEVLASAFPDPQNAAQAKPPAGR